MSFACPHFDIDQDFCLALGADCVPGRPGCVLRNNSVFYVPVEQRLPPRGEPVKPLLAPASAVGPRRPARRRPRAT